MLSRRGFTLIELMIVVVIIGILAGLALPRFFDYTRNSKEAEAMPILKQIYTLQERHRAKNNDYTLDITTLEGGPTLSTSGRYFSYSVVAHASGFCAVASPNAAGTVAELAPHSIDANGDFHESNNCS